MCLNERAEDHLLSTKIILDYMTLGRLQIDCEYFLGYGYKNPKYLQQCNVDRQIEEMKRIWNNFPENEKPEWISMEDINNYEKKMKEDTREASN
jgi:hypothetical protein